MNEQPPDIIAQLDQASAGGKNLAVLFCSYFRALVAEGLTREEAICMVIEYQRIVLVDRWTP